MKYLHEHEDFKYFIIEAAKDCIADYGNENGEITQKDLERQIDITKPSLDNSDLDKYNTEKREIIGGQDE